VKVQILKNKNLRWEFGVRYSYNDNKIQSLYQDVTQFVYGGYSYASTYMIKDKRYPFLKASGYERDPATGMIVVDASSGYPSQAAGLADLGCNLPRHILGAGSKVEYKNFQLSFNFEYRGGNVC